MQRKQTSIAITRCTLYRAIERLLVTVSVLLTALWIVTVALVHPAYAQPKPGQQPQIPPGATQLGSIIKTIDPCVIATQDQLKSLLSAGIGGYFPLSQNKQGESTTISDPRLTDLTCPNLRITIFAHIHYKKSRGVPQYSTSGDVRFTSPLVVRVWLAPGNPPALQKASACLTSINVIGLNLKNIPNWLDSTWVRNWLNGQLANRMCFDMTPFVQLYLQQGGKL